MNNQRGFGFLHIVAILFFAIAAGIGYQQYRKKVEAEAIAEAQKKETEARRVNAEKITGQIIAMVEISRELNSATDLAGATARIALAPQVQRIQEIQFRIGKLSADGCAAPAKEALENQAQLSVDGFIAFMGKSEFDSHLKLFESTKQNLVFLEQMTACREQIEPDLNAKK